MAAYSGGYLKSLPQQSSDQNYEKSFFTARDRFVDQKLNLEWNF